MSETLISWDTRLPLACGLVLKNRFCKAAMTEGLATAKGCPSASLRHLYSLWAQGGAALLVSGNIMVDRRYLERAGNVVVEDERHLRALGDWAQAVHAHGTQLWGQISHPGRQCPRSVTLTPLAPSEVQLHVAANFGKPRVMQQADIEDVIGRFAQTARLLQQAGFDGVQVHAAHGYLLSQFLSKRTNLREDQWGGDLAGRARLLLEVIRAIRLTVGGNFGVSVKINSSDFVQGGFTLDECDQVVQWLGQEGVDLLELSGGTYEQVEFFRAMEPTQMRESTWVREAMFLEHARVIRAKARMPLMVTGGFRTRGGMLSALAQGETDMLGLARPFCLDPDLPRRLMSGELQALPMPEAGLVLGAGRRGPNSSSAHWRGLNNQAHAAWYYCQIERLAAGMSPLRLLSPWRALITHFGKDFGRAIRRKLTFSAG